MTAREPVPFETYQPGVYLHGTKADLTVGDLLVPGRESNFEAGRRMNYVYFTATLDAATWGAEFALGELTDWIGHPPERLQAMRAGLEALRQQGKAQIED